MEQILFKVLSDRAEDFTLCWKAFSVLRSEWGEIRSAIDNRLEAEKQYIEDRVKTLEALKNSKTRTPTMRAMAEKEIAELREREPKPTEQEVNALADKVREIEAAIEDFKKSRTSLREAFFVADAELKRTKEATLNAGKYSEQQADNWLREMKLTVQSLKAQLR